jgi:hypothetical protein
LEAKRAEEERVIKGYGLYPMDNRPDITLNTVERRKAPIVTARHREKMESALKSVDCNYLRG